MLEDTKDNPESLRLSSYSEESLLQWEYEHSLVAYLFTLYQRY